MTALTRLPFCLCAAFLVAVSGAPDLTSQATIQSRTWPATLPTSGSFSRIVHGDFGGDLRTSAVLVRDNKAYFDFEPATYFAVSLIPVPDLVFDAATLPDNGVIGRDRVVFVSPSGLYLGVLNYAQGGFVVAPIADNAWLGARRVIAGYDGNAEWLAGIPADPNKIVTRHKVSGPWQVGFSVTLSNPIRDLLFVDWDHDGANELVAVTQDGLHPYELSGAPLAGLASAPAHTADFLARLPVAGAGDEVVWLYESGGSWAVTVVDQGVPDLPVPVAPGLFGGAAMDVTGIATGDLDGDGDGDLLISQQATGQTVILVNHVGEPGVDHFDAGDPDLVFTIDADAPTSSNPCPGVLADFDHDGAVEAIFTLDSTNTRLMLDGIADAIALALGLPGGGGYTDGEVTLVGPPSCELVSPSASRLTFALDPGDHVGERLELVVWHQSGPYEFVDATAQHTVIMDPYGVGDDIVVELGVASSLGPHGQLIWDGSDHFYFDVRFVGGSGPTTIVSPSLIFGLTVQVEEDQAVAVYMDYLRNLPDGPGGSGPEDSILQNGNKQVGGIIPNKRMPPMQTAIPADPAYPL